MRLRFNGSAVFDLFNLHFNYLSTGTFICGPINSAALHTVSHPHSRCSILLSFIVPEPLCVASINQKRQFLQFSHVCWNICKAKLLKYFLFYNLQFSDEMFFSLLFMFSYVTQKSAAAKVIHATDRPATFNTQITVPRIAFTFSWANKRATR